VHRNITQDIYGCNAQDKFPWANPVALRLQEISLGSTGNLNRFWARRVLSLSAEYGCYIMGYTESMWVADPQCLLIPSQCSPIPVQRFLILSLPAEYQCHITDCTESFFFLKIINRIHPIRVWRWTAAPGLPGGLSPPHESRASPCPILLRVSGWSTPNAFSFPANAR